MPHVHELALGMGRCPKFKQLQQWQMPSYPINGGHLKKVGISPGPQFGRVLKELTEKWKESYFTLTEDELIQEASKYSNIYS